jgi:hypothetical protein
MVIRSITTFLNDDNTPFQVSVQDITTKYMTLSTEGIAGSNPALRTSCYHGI